MIKRCDRQGIVWLMAFAVVMALSSSGAWANRGAPTFAPAIWGDGELWATKGVASLPPPTDNNVQSYDKLLVVTNSNNPMGQLPVAEAAPRNFNYNGGRWFTHTVEWTQDAFNALGTVPVLKSYDDIMLYESMGYLTVTPGSPQGGPPNFFECPLLPVK
jgi:hypothetical protein